MAQSYARGYTHIVFSTKERRPFFQDATLREETHQVIGGVCNQRDCQVLRVGGATDHVHLLCQLGTTVAIADLVKEVKRESTAWMKQNVTSMSSFQWQSGYGAFSVSPSHVEATRRYIGNQIDHHRKVSFEDEYRRLLTKYGVQWDERFLWG